MANNQPNFEKRRGKIPKDHENILINNHNELMRQIKIDHITDCMFTNQLIDWNEKDAIDTRLSSKGNQKALNYFVSQVLPFSGNQALPTFIRCLEQAGYSKLAKRLQNASDNASDSTSLQDDMTVTSDNAYDSTVTSDNAFGSTSLQKDMTVTLDNAFDSTVTSVKNYHDIEDLK